MVYRLSGPRGLGSHFASIVKAPPIIFQPSGVLTRSTTSMPQ
jgi:hypothetical protein